MDRPLSSNRASGYSTLSSASTSSNPINQSAWNAQRASTQSTLSAWSVQTPKEGDVLGLPFLEVEYARNVEEENADVDEEHGDGTEASMAGKAASWWAGTTPKARERRQSIALDLARHIDYSFLNTRDTDTRSVKLDDSPTLPTTDLPILVNRSLACRPRIPSPYSSREMENYFSLGAFYEGQAEAGPSRYGGGREASLHATSGERDGSIKSSSSGGSKTGRKSRRTVDTLAHLDSDIPAIPTRISSRRRPVVTSRASSLRLSGSGNNRSSDIPPIPPIPARVPPPLLSKQQYFHPPPVTVTRASSYKSTIFPTPLSSIRETSPPRLLTDLDRTPTGDWAIRQRPKSQSLHRSISQPALSTSTMPRKFTLRRSTSSQFGTSTIGSISSFIAFETPSSRKCRESKESDGINTIKSRKSAFRLFRGDQNQDEELESSSTSTHLSSDNQGYTEDDNASQTSSQSGGQPRLGSEINLCEDGRTDSVKRRIKPKSSFIDFGEALSTPLPVSATPRKGTKGLKGRKFSRPSLLSAFPEWTRTSPRNGSITSFPNSFSTSSLTLSTPSVLSTQSSTNLPISVLRRPAPQLQLAFDRQRTPAIRLRVKDGSIVHPTSPEELKLDLSDDLGDLRSDDWGAIILAETWGWPCPPGCGDFPVPVLVSGMGEMGEMVESGSYDTLGSPKTPNSGSSGSDGEPDLVLHGEREFEKARKRKDEMLRKRRGMLEGLKKREMEIEMEMGRPDGEEDMGLGLSLDGGV